MRLFIAFLGLLMLVGPIIYWGYRTYKKGELRFVLKGAAWTLFGVCWLAVALWLLTRA